MLVLTDANATSLQVRARVTSSGFTVEKVDCDHNECDVVVKRITSGNSAQPGMLLLTDVTGIFVEVPIATISKP